MLGEWGGQRDTRSRDYDNVFVIEENGCSYLKNNNTLFRRHTSVSKMQVKVNPAVARLNADI